MKIYRAFVKDGEMEIREEGVAKYNLVYNRSKGNATLRQGSVTRKIPSTKIDTYTAINYMNGLLMIFNPYFDPDMGTVRKCFGCELIVKLEVMVAMLKQDLAELNHSIESIEKEIKT